MDRGKVDETHMVSRIVAQAFIYYFLVGFTANLFYLYFTVKQNLPGDPKSADYPYQALKGSF